MPAYLCRDQIGADGVCRACGRKHGPEIEMTIELPPEQHKRFGDYLRRKGEPMVRGEKRADQ